MDAHQVTIHGRIFTIKPSGFSYSGSSFTLTADDGEEFNIKGNEELSSDLNRIIYSVQELS